MNEIVKIFKKIYNILMIISLIIVVIMQITLYNLNISYINRAEVLLSQNTGDKELSRYVNYYINAVKHLPVSLLTTTRPIVTSLEIVDTANSISNRLDTNQNISNTINTREMFIGEINRFRIVRDDAELESMINKVLLTDFNDLEYSEYNKKQLEINVDSLINKLNYTITKMTLVSIIGTGINISALNKILSILLGGISYCIRKIKLKRQFVCC